MRRFKPRSVQRDRQNDMKRLRRAVDTITAIGEELEQEINGLARRYEAFRDEANAALLSLDDGSCAEEPGEDLDQLGEAMMYCEGRLALLRSMKARLDNISAQLQDMDGTKPDDAQEYVYRNVRPR